MEQSLAYKPGAAAVIERLRALYERRSPDRICAAMELPSAALQRFAARYPQSYCAAPDPRERIAFWDELLRERIAVADDSIPSAYLSELDQGLYGGLLGGEVRFMAHPENGWISSMVAPILESWEGFEGLRFERSHPWFRRYLEQLEIFVAGAAGKFAISHFILIDGLNLVFELVGATATYESLLDRPEMVRRAIELAYEVNEAVQAAFFERVPALAGGTCSNMVQWVPGRIVSESVDPFHMTSLEYFERWGRETVQRIFDRFDGGVLHLHGNGRHLLEAVASLRGLKAIYLGDDRGYPPVVEVLAELRARAGDIPLVLALDFEVLRAKMARHELAGGVFYQVRGAPDETAANRCMEEVRAYRVA